VSLSKEGRQQNKAHAPAAREKDQIDLSPCLDLGRLRRDDGGIGTRGFHLFSFTLPIEDPFLAAYAITWMVQDMVDHISPTAVQGFSSTSSLQY
jgi:hypothetical protein